MAAGGPQAAGIINNADCAPYSDEEGASGRYAFQSQRHTVSKLLGLANARTELTIMHHDVYALPMEFATWNRKTFACWGYTLWPASAWPCDARMLCEI